MRRLAPALLVLLLALVPAYGQAQDTPNRAGLVVQYADGDTQTYCVAFREERISGEELLERAGLALVVQRSSLGTAVCKIGGTGCNYPGEDCWCQCRGAECRYWSYYLQIDGVWQYSNTGAHARMLADGDVDGWAWGPGTSAAGTAPVLVPFDEICISEATISPTLAMLPVPVTATAPPAPQPGGTPAPVEPLPASADGYLWFGGLAGLLVIGVGIAAWHNRRRG